MSGAGALLVGCGLCFFARVLKRTVAWWLLAVVVPPVLLGAEDLIDTDHQAVAVNPLAAVDFERLRVRHEAPASHRR